MAKRTAQHPMQTYARTEGEVLSDDNLYAIPPPMDTKSIDLIIDRAFQRSGLDKTGKTKMRRDTPEQLIDQCIKHLRERSDPILSPSFLAQCEVENVFELDAVSHEMQQHRIAMGLFYQYLLLELVHQRFSKSFDGSSEDDIVVDIDTPHIGAHKQGLRIYMSVKKSGDTVGGQDVGGVIRRLETRAKQEKNLTRPYLCVIAVATPSGGKIRPYNKDRKVKRDKNKNWYSMNCETWGPGFLFPYLTGRQANEIYALAFKHVAKHLPFMTLKYKSECALLLKEKLLELGLLNEKGLIDPRKFLAFCSKEA